MNLTQEQREQIVGELKKFGSELGLSQEQKEKLHNSLTEAYGKIQDFKNQKGPQRAPSAHHRYLGCPSHPPGCAFLRVRAR